MVTREGYLLFQAKALEVKLLLDGQSISGNHDSDAGSLLSILRLRKHTMSWSRESFEEQVLFLLTLLGYAKRHTFSCNLNHASHSFVVLPKQQICFRLCSVSGLYCSAVYHRPAAHSYHRLEQYHSPSSIVLWLVYSRDPFASAPYSPGMTR